MINMDSDKSQLDDIIIELTQDYLAKIKSVASPNLSIYNVLEILYQKGDIKELGIFLALAEHKAIKTETLIDLTKEKISKSTVYRKLNDYEQSGLLKKNANGYWELEESLKPLEILSDLRKIQLNKK